MNRKQRLEREMSDRRYARASKLRDWVRAMKNRLEPFARAIANDESSTSFSTAGVHWSLVRILRSSNHVN